MTVRRNLWLRTEKGTLAHNFDIRLIFQMKSFGKIRRKNPRKYKLGNVEQRSEDTDNI